MKQKLLPNSSVHSGYFFVFLLNCHLPTNTIRLFNNLDPGQNQCFVGPDLFVCLI